MRTTVHSEKLQLLSWLLTVSRRRSRSSRAEFRSYATDVAFPERWRGVNGTSKRKSTRGLLRLCIDTWGCSKFLLLWTDCVSSLLSLRSLKLTRERSLLSKSVGDLAQDIKGLISTIAALTPNPNEAQKNCQRLDDILKFLLPLSEVPSGVQKAGETLRRWDEKWQGKNADSKAAS